MEAETMSYLYLDIETIPAQSGEVRERIAATIKPPGNIKKAETIAVWEAEQKPAAVVEAIHRTGLNGAYGSICCIGWAIDGEPAASLDMHRQDDETDMLAGFFDLASRRIGNRRPVIVGHNVIGFDLRFVWQRAIVLGVKVPGWLPRDPKPWDGNVFDTMTAWAGSRDTISMDNLCAALGIEGKDGIDGSMVAGMWESGEYDAIAKYCRQDVERTRAIHQKMQIAFGEAA